MENVKIIKLTSGEEVVAVIVDDEEIYLEDDSPTWMLLWKPFRQVFHSTRSGIVTVLVPWISHCADDVVPLDDTKVVSVVNADEVLSQLYSDMCADAKPSSADPAREYDQKDVDVLNLTMSADKDKPQ